MMNPSLRQTPRPLTPPSTLQRLYMEVHGISYDRWVSEEESASGYTSDDEEVLFAQLTEAAQYGEPPHPASASPAISPRTQALTARHFVPGREHVGAQTLLSRSARLASPEGSPSPIGAGPSTPVQGRQNAPRSYFSPVTPEVNLSLPRLGAAVGALRAAGPRQSPPGRLSSERAAVRATGRDWSVGTAPLRIRPPAAARAVLTYGEAAPLTTIQFGEIRFTSSETGAAEAVVDEDCFGGWLPNYGP